MLALQAGVQGIVCSNHGGRQLDTARSGVEILAEVACSVLCTLDVSTGEQVGVGGHTMIVVQDASACSSLDQWIACGDSMENVY